MPSMIAPFRIKYFRTEILLDSTIKALVVHSIALYAFYLSITGRTPIKTVLFHLSLFYLSVLGKLIFLHPTGELEINLAYRHVMRSAPIVGTQKLSDESSD